MELREMNWKAVDWIHLAQDRDQGWALVNADEPSGSMKAVNLTICGTTGFSRKILLHGIS
jgi:hypothetical protein